MLYGCEWNRHVESDYLTSSMVGMIFTSYLRSKCGVVANLSH